MNGKTTEIPKQECPHCKREITCASTDTRDKPEENDFNVCLYCGGYSRFTADLHLRKLADGEEDAMDPETKRGMEDIRLRVKLSQSQLRIAPRGNDAVFARQLFTKSTPFAGPAIKMNKKVN